MKGLPCIANPQSGRLAAPLRAIQDNESRTGQSSAVSEDFRLPAHGREQVKNNGSKPTGVVNNNDGCAVFILVELSSTKSEALGLRRVNVKVDKFALHLWKTSGKQHDSYHAAAPQIRKAFRKPEKGGRNLALSRHSSVQWSEELVAAYTIKQQQNRIIQAKTSE